MISPWRKYVASLLKNVNYTFLQTPDIPGGKSDADAMDGGGLSRGWFFTISFRVRL